jgi:thioredoxin 1
MNRSFRGLWRKDEMKKNNVFLLMILIFSFALIGCSKKETKPENNSPAVNNISTNNNYAIEFIELGSVNCIPCKKMQPIMQSIEKKYGGKVKVTFYDVWKDDAPAKKYGIDLIPTQVFLDSNGKELMRHQGFYAEGEIDKFLSSHGLVIIQ